MLGSHIFGKATAYVGIVRCLATLGFFLPVIGIPVLFLSTIGSALFQFMLSRRLLELA